MCLTPGGPVSEAKAECEKKASDRESAEAIVPGAPNREGPNVVNVSADENNYLNNLLILQQRRIGKYTDGVKEALSK